MLYTWSDGYLSRITGEFPTEWKLALIKPLLKKPGLATTLNNYRPISNLSFISKITERAVISQHKEHMEQNCLLPIMSLAYRQGHSTESALLKVQADILHNMEQQQVTLLVLIDLSAAFDTVDHPILFQCLEEWFGFHDSVLSWYKLYLSDRKQSIILNGMWSNILHLPFGVPQGSCLGQFCLHSMLVPFLISSTNIRYVPMPMPMITSFTQNFHQTKSV